MKALIKYTLFLTSVALSLIFTPGKLYAGSDPFIGEINYVGFNFAPRNWAHCDGQLLSIAQNTALFSLFGTLYGGDGRTTFGLPDMRGRVPIHRGNGPGLSNYTQGQKGGNEEITLTINHLPVHNHFAAALSVSALNVSSDVGNSIPSNNYLGGSAGLAKIYSTIVPDVTLNAGAVSTTTSVTVANAGGGQQFPVLQPYLVINCVVALTGTFPSRN